jgi:PAS domain S-box-containing protein
MDSVIDFTQLVMAASDAIIAADSQGAITLWNAAAERIFGFTESEALGKSLDLIIPERQRQRHWHGYDQTMQRGETRYATNLLRVPALHKDGHTLSIAFTVSLLFSSEKKPMHIVAIVRDESSRWMEERAVHQRLTELEAKLRQSSEVK